MPRLKTWDDIFAIPFTKTELDKARRAANIKPSEITKDNLEYQLKIIKEVAIEIRIEKLNNQARKGLQS